MDMSPPQAEQFILYEGDGVEVFFSDGGRLQLSPCGTTFIYQQMSPLAGQQFSFVDFMDLISEKI